MKNTTRRLFLSGMAKIGAAIPIAASVLPEQVQAVAGAAPREERLRRALSYVADIVDADFSEYEYRVIEMPVAPGEFEKPRDILFAAFLRDLASPPPPPPALNYEGPGIYEIALAGWGREYTQIRRVEAMPSGQFRFRWPKAKPHARWIYKAAAQFASMRRVPQ